MPAKLLFLAKREPQQRDLITRPYGRFHNLPTELARRGHEVLVLLISHKGTVEEELVRDDVRWICIDPRSRGLAHTLSVMTEIASAFRPNWVIGCSDAWYGWFAHRLARSTGASLAIDAYDNYEAYMPWNLPVHLLWRRAVAAADLVTVAGPQLAERLARSRPGKFPPHVLPMAADPDFQPRERAAARQALNLPLEAPLLGYFGGWAANRGTDMIATMFRRVREALPSARLVLSGRPPESICREPGVIKLGYVDDGQLPHLISAMDVACVITSDSSFGRFSYPAKLCEAMACGVPVVATATKPVRWMLGNDTRFLVPLGDPAAFAHRVIENIRLGQVNYGPQARWPEVAETLDSLLTGITGTVRP